MQLLPLMSPDAEHLGPAQQRVTKFVASRPEEIERMTISHLAKATRVSPGTITKLCHKLGYQDFRTFRLEVAKANASAPRASVTAGSGTIEDRIRLSAERLIRVIERTRQTLNRKALERAIHALEKAERIVFFGVGGSSAIATDARFRFLRLGIGAVVFTDRHLQVWTSTTLEPRDLVVAISHSGRTRDTIEATSLAKEAGCTTIAITSDKYSPLAKLADVCLVSCFEEIHDEGSISARLSQIWIVDALAEELATRHPEYIEHERKVRSALKKEFNLATVNSS